MKVNAPVREKILRSIWIASMVLFTVTSANAGNASLVPAPASCPPAGPAQTQPIKSVVSTSAFAPISAQARTRIFISAKDALTEAKHVLLVDARRDQDTAKFWIPNAIHVQPNFLSSNALAQNADTVVLVGDGKDDALLLQAVQGLQGSRKNPIRILSGGLAAWYRAGGTVEGNIALLDAPAILDASEFHDLAVQNATIVMLGKPSSEQRKAFPKLLELPADIAPQAAIASLRGRVNGQTPVVLLLHDTAPATDWTRSWLDTFHQSLYIFVDPGNRYTGFLDQQKHIAANAGKPLQHPCGVY